MIDVTTRAAKAAPEYGGWSAQRRHDLLYACADALASRVDDVVAVAHEESGLSTGRLQSEMDRTAGQLRLLGDSVLADAPVRRSPGVAAGGADVVTVTVPVGPVAVFAASNFPLAFGVPGGDTGSALAAGCPVVVKAHPAQPQTSRLLGDILAAAVAKAGAPDGTFALVEGGPEASIALVMSPPIRAVGFTGSLGGGRALMDAAARRPDPIPVYAEMGSLNPVFVLPGAATDPAWVATLAGAVTWSSGQLCTKPGLVVVPSTPDGEALAEALAKAVAGSTTHRMLTAGMAGAHAAWLEKARALPGAVVTAGSADPAPFAVRVPANALHGELVEEHFGPTVVIGSASVDSYPRIVAELQGSLTATVLADASDVDTARALLPALAANAGRVIYNGVPTGVAVCEAMQHGGPWPATSAPWSTSVGTAAIERFRRPVAFQGVPESLLPS